MKRRHDGRRRWEFWRTQVIDDLRTHDIHMKRLRMVQTPWFGVWVHHLYLPDQDRDLHDHPWEFVTLILKGGYIEEFMSSQAASRIRRRTWGRWSVHRMRLSQFHAIRRVLRTPTTTLVLAGPVRHEWGYATPNGWVHHDRYHLARGVVGETEYRRRHNIEMA